MRFFMCMVLPVIMTMVSGCFFSRAEELKVTEYAPELHPAAAENRELQIGSVVNMSGSGREFVIRRKDGRIAVDESRRWLIMPEQMLKNAMSLHFNGNGRSRINAEMIKFEFSADLSELSAIVIFRVKGDDGENFSRCASASVKIVKGDYGKAVSELWKILFAKVKKI